MTVKLAILKSGENIVTDIQEMVVDEKIVGFLFNKPQLVMIKDFGSVSENNQDTSKHSFDVNLFPWIPFSEEDKIPIPSDWVVTLLEPVEKLKNMYVEKILKPLEENDKTDSTAQ
jgi:hypothetical protein